MEILPLYQLFAVFESDWVQIVRRWAMEIEPRFPAKFALRRSTCNPSSKVRSLTLRILQESQPFQCLDCILNKKNWSKAYKAVYLHSTNIEANALADSYLLELLQIDPDFELS